MTRRYMSADAVKRADSPVGRFVRAAALLIAAVVGISVIYLCLLPALAENAGDPKFIYFDNGLAGYDRVLYSTDGGNTWNDMALMSQLDSSDERMEISFDHVNTDYTYVTANAVAPGTDIMFRGYDSGVVYDTTVIRKLDSNGNPSDGSKMQWGYDYENFVWTSGAYVVDEVNNCFYAPALAMQNKVADHIVSYQNDYNHRTFSDEAYEMTGVFGDLNDVNRSGEYSQEKDSEGSCYTNTAEGDNKTNAVGDKSGNEAKAQPPFKATARIFDYFSDWELSGNKLTDLVDGTTFTNSTSSIAYAYQGDLWNKALRDYYDGSVDKLVYFGSNSWFPGVDYGLGQVDGVTPDYYYISQFPDYFLPAHGFSNSRGVAELVKTRNDNGLELAGTDVPSPYFNEAFITGDNDRNAVYGRVYNDIDFDFEYNSATGYYEFSSTDPNDAVRLTECDDGRYVMQYTREGVTKADNTSSTGYQFYPMNSPATNSNFATENLMFGMELDLDFVTYGSAVEGRTNGIFKFSGDDDVWIYLDNQLALDIGGTHTAVSGVIDLNTGYGVVGSTFDDETGGTLERITDAQKAAFAVGTNDGIYNRSTWTDIVGTVNMFDDTYSGGQYRTTIDEENGLYIVEIKDVKNVKTSGSNYSDTYKFRLNSVDMSEGEAEGDLITHKMKIYFMERGLNSSNFKLAFNFLDSVERGVSKTWLDDGFTDHSNDSVEVELYRSINTFTTRTEGAQDVLNCGFEDGTEGWTSNADAVIGIDSADPAFGENALSITGRNASWIGAIKTLDPALFKAGKEYSFSAMVKSRPDYIYNSFDSGDAEGWITRGDNFSITSDNISNQTGGKSIKINAGNSSSWQDWYGAQKPLDGFCDSGNTYYFSLYMRPANTKNPTVFEMGIQYDLNGTTHYEPIDNYTPTDNSWHQLSGSHSIPEGAANIRVYVQESTKVNFYIDDFTVSKTESPDVTSGSDDNIKLTLRYPDETQQGGYSFNQVASEPVPSGVWTELGGTFRVPDDASGPFDLIIESQNGTDDIFADEVRVYEAGAEPTVINTYTEDVQKIGEATLSDATSWEKVWENLLDSETIANGRQDYQYFAREKSVNTRSPKKYAAKYFDGDSEVTASEIDFEGDTITVFPINAQTGSLSIENRPLTDLTVKKEWFRVLEDEKADDIVVDIYNDHDSIVRTVTLHGDKSADTWTAELKDLEMYYRDTESGEVHPINYYGIERDDPDHEYKVTYSTDTTETFGGNTAYKFSSETEDEPLSLKITNKPDKSGTYSASVHKQSAASGKAPIKGAEFLLEKYTDGAYTEVTTAKTDESGNVKFENLEANVKYRVTETKSALGYKLPEEESDRQTEFMISADIANNLDGSSPIISNGSIYSSHEWDGTGDRLSLVMENEVQPILMPSTGGSGILLIYICGAFMTVTALGLVLVYRRRCR